MRWLVLVGWVASSLSLAPGDAWASPRSLGMSYPYETLHEADVALVQYVDIRSELKMEPRHELDPRFGIQIEYEYGISSHVELGFYLALDADHHAPLRLDGTRQRLRLRLGERDKWPLDIAFNVELIEYEYALAFEQTAIIQKGLGLLTLVANTTFEEELEEYRFDPAFILGQTVGFDVVFGEHVHLGAEYWLRAILQNNHAVHHILQLEQQENLELALRYQNFLGPALSFQWERFWWTTNAYFRLDSFHDLPPAFNHAEERAYERLRVRSVLGINL